jgi:fermentation-respiration switch protein FrsA (DUF1100 family)
VIWIIAAAALIALALIAGYVGFREACAWGRRIDPLDAKTYQKGIYAKNAALLHENARALAEIPAEDLYITSCDGLRLHGRLLPLESPKATILMFHGYHSFADVDFGCAVPLLREMGYQLLLVDERAHQGSEGKYITYGVKERRDVLSWADEMAARLGPAHPLYLQGISMGAATVLMASALPLPDCVRGIIADCPFTEPKAIIRHVAAGMRIPGWISVPLAASAAAIFGRFRLGGASALEAVRGAKLPILLIHGEDDHFVPCDMSREIAAANPEKIRFHTFPGAGHGLSYLVDEPRYTGLIRDFTSEIL